jgi:hypothetical protein
MQSAESELEFRLNGSEVRDPEFGRSGDRSIEQGRLSDSALAANNDRAALARPRGIEQTLERCEFDLSIEKRRARGFNHPNTDSIFEGCRRGMSGAAQCCTGIGS